MRITLPFTLTPTRKVTLLTCAALYFLSQVLFLVNIQFPRGYNFDEFHYVPAAKQYLELKENRNWEHPPLGKEIMALSIAVGGDRPFGWRLASAIMGSLTLVGMYLLALALFKSQRAALIAALLTAFNFLLYVQARIGMLDTFMFCFVVWALWAFVLSWDPKSPLQQNRRLLLFAGLMLGLATATKWWAVIPWFLCLVLILKVRFLQYWQTSFGPTPSTKEWYHTDLYKGLQLFEVFAYLLVVPLFFYFLTFLPVYFLDGPKLGFGDLFRMQTRMWDGQLRVVTNHPYMSHWTDWAILKRPIWYAFDKEGPKDVFVRGVLLLGSPLLMWSGLLALLACFWSFVTQRGRDVFFITAFFAAFYFCWAVIPRKINFYYYYYPAGMILSLALTWVLLQAEQLDRRFRWVTLSFVSAAFLLFVYFFPILAALRITSESFRKWMWLTSWI